MFLLVALASVIAVQGLGNLLVVAVLVGPAATARLVAKRVVPMMFTAASLAVIAGVLGLCASYYLRTAGGASVAGAMLVLYLAVMMGKAISRGARSLRHETTLLEASR